MLTRRRCCVRDSQRVVGGFELKIDDFVTRRQFPDLVGAYSRDDVYSRGNQKEGVRALPEGFDGKDNPGDGKCVGIPYSFLHRAVPRISESWAAVSRQHRGCTVPFVRGLLRYVMARFLRTAHTREETEMFRSTIVAGMALLTVAMAAQGQDRAETNYPTKPIKVIVGYSPGGSNDILARMVARRFQESLGQTVLVENKPSTGAIVGAVATANAPPDGYTLMIGASGPIVVNPAVYQSLPYAPQRDFTPISLIATFPLIVSVKAGSSFGSLNDLVKFTKENPKSSNYASSSATFQLATEMLMERTGIVAEHVPYKGSGDSMNAVASGVATFGLLDPGPASGAIKGNLIRGLAVTSEKRMSAFPEVATLREKGIDLQIRFWIGLFAPAGTPAPIVRLLERETAKAVSHPETLKSMAQLGLEPASGTSEAFTRQIAQEIQTWSALAKQKNIKVE